MSDTTAAAPTVEKESDFGAEPERAQRRWLAEIEAFERERKDYCERVEKITTRYRNEHLKKERRFALLWANVEVLKPTVYARDPVPRVFRRFRDRDPVGRVAATLLERTLTCQIERNGDYGQAIRSAVFDFLLCGQGAAWVFYAPTLEQGAVTDERAYLGHVHWRDIGFTAGARTWAEVGAIWRIAYMTRAELVERFGKAGEDVPLDRRSAEARSESRKETPGADVIGKATIYEVWDSAKREVTWLYKAGMKPLDVRPYPLKLRGQFPCPRPMFGTLTTSSTVPVPDYLYYQDQALEIDDLTARIAVLSKALKLIGFIPGETQADIQKGLSSAQEIALVPVEAWALGQGRPMDNAIAWLPVMEIAGTLDRLVQLREAIKRDAYEITGLSDILRGSTDAGETATAQSIKAQWGSVRVRDRQGEVARFARDCIEIMADVVCGHFDPERILAEANAQAIQGTEAQYVPAAVELLKGEGALRNYRIDVETDSTIAPDEMAERQAATELLTGVSGYLAQTMPIIQATAQGAPQAVAPMTEMVGGLLTQAVRRFRGGDEVEELIERAMQAIAQPAPQQDAGPSPEIVAAQADAQARSAELQAKSAEAAAQLQAKGAEAAARLDLDRERMMAEMQIKAQELALREKELDIKRAQIEAQELEAAAKAELELLKLQDGADARTMQAAEAAKAPAEAPEPKSDDDDDKRNAAMESTLAALTAAIERMSQPRAIRVQRDGAGRLTGAETV
jgi:hypothetical protein